jgi:hypothetical protein
MGNALVLTKPIKLHYHSYDLLMDSFDSKTAKTVQKAS